MEVLPTCPLPAEFKPWEAHRCPHSLRSRRGPWSWAELEATVSRGAVAKVRGGPRLDQGCAAVL